LVPQPQRTMGYDGQCELDTELGMQMQMVWSQWGLQPHGRAFPPMYGSPDLYPIGNALQPLDALHGYQACCPDASLHLGFQNDALARVNAPVQVPADNHCSRAARKRRSRRSRAQAKGATCEGDQEAPDGKNDDDVQHPAEALLLQLGGAAHEAALMELKAAFADLAFDAQGCRVVQDALDRVPNEEKSLLACELSGRVREALACKHANYVIQKMVEVMPTERVQFIVDELLGSAVQIAQHRFGVRILCRLLEHCPHEQTNELMAEVLCEVSKLCRHSYGNYVIQQMLEHGTVDQKRSVHQVLLENALGFATHRTASSVVEHALSHGSQEDRDALLRVLAYDGEAFARVACSRWGCRVVAGALMHLAEARALAAMMQPVLQESKYGRRVLEELSI